MKRCGSPHPAARPRMGPWCARPQGHIGMHDAKDGTTMAWADLPIHRLRRKAELEAQNAKPAGGP